jgi:hypothetical protein
VSKAYYFGYKLHHVTFVRGVFTSMDISKASVHDVHFLSEIKHSKLSNCTLIGDKGYLSKQHQLDLFTSCNIRFQTPKRANQKDKVKFEFVFSKSRKRIETLFSQLCDQNLFSIHLQNIIFLEKTDMRILLIMDHLLLFDINAV